MMFQPEQSALSALDGSEHLPKSASFGRSYFAVAYNPQTLSSPRAAPKLNAPQDLIKRTSRASLPISFAPGTSLEDFMEPPTLYSKSRHNSISSHASSDRSSFESRFDRSVSLTSGVKSSRTSTDSAYGNGSPIYGNRVPQCPPAIPQRSTSWDPTYYRNGNPPKQTTLLRPQRLSSTARLTTTPGGAFRKLPKEILVIVFDELKNLHLYSDNKTCATCYMRDICALSLCNRKLSSVARGVLYDTILLNGSDSTHNLKKKLKMRYGTRLKLLQRTLAAHSQLAALVRTLKVPDIPSSITSKKEREEYLDMVASVLMCCPNLERLLDFHIPYNHEFSRLAHARSTRTNLIEHVWNIKPSLYKITDPTVISYMPPGPLLPEQHVAFLSHHENWTHLQTLVIHCAPGGTLDPLLLARTLRLLPSLAHLTLSALPFLPPDQLSSLPPLKSLNLANIPTLSANHLSTFVTTSSASSLESLVLTNPNLTSLPILARLLANLKSLKRFSFTQCMAPTLPIGISISLHPYLASPTLTYLHWDIITPSPNSIPGNRKHDATWILAKAIKAGGFPKLQRIRAPGDYDGLVQSVCRPVERIDWISDKISHANGKRSSVGSRKDSGIALSAQNGSTDELPQSRSLSAARHAAQARIDAARSRPRFYVLCEDWSDPARVRVTARFEFGGFMGTIGSRVHYSLELDVEGSDTALVSVEDVLGNRGRARKGGSGEVCIGAWNAGRKGWEHRERTRYLPLEVEMLF